MGNGSAQLLEKRAEDPRPLPGMAESRRGACGQPLACRRHRVALGAQHLLELADALLVAALLAVDAGALHDHVGPAAALAAARQRTVGHGVELAAARRE